MAVQTFAFKGISLDKALKNAKEFMGKKHTVVSVDESPVEIADEKFEGKILIESDDLPTTWAMRGYSIQFAASV